MLAERLKKLREEKGLKQETLAHEIGCTRYMISYYENGRAPSYDVLKAYCKYFDVSADYLLGLSNDKKPAGGALDASFSTLSQLTGDDALTGGTVAALLGSAIKYYRAGAPCGNTPLVALRGFVEGLRATIDAATASDVAGLIDAANATVSAALDVAKMPIALQSQDE